MVRNVQETSNFLFTVRIQPWSTVIASPGLLSLSLFCHFPKKPESVNSPVLNSFPVRINFARLFGSASKLSRQMSTTSTIKHDTLFHQDAIKKPFIRRSYFPSRARERKKLINNARILNHHIWVFVHAGVWRSARVEMRRKRKNAHSFIG